MFYWRTKTLFKHNTAGFASASAKRISN